MLLSKLSFSEPCYCEKSHFFIQSFVSQPLSAPLLVYRWSLCVLSRAGVTIARSSSTHNVHALHQLELASSPKCGCGCSWETRQPASVPIHAACPCCPAPNIVASFDCCSVSICTAHFVAERLVHIFEKSPVLQHEPVARRAHKKIQYVHITWLLEASKTETPAALPLRGAAFPAPCILPVLQSFAMCLFLLQCGTSCRCESPWLCSLLPNDLRLCT